MKLLRIAILLVSVATLSACEAKPTSVGVCDLGYLPKQFDRTNVVVSARMFSDGLERISLYDDACPNVSIAVSYTDEASRSTEARKIEQIFFNSERHGADKSVQAKFQGKFVWRSNQIPALLLVVEAISGLSIKPGPPRNLDKVL